MTEDFDDYDEEFVHYQAVEREPDLWSVVYKIFFLGLLWTVALSCLAAIAVLAHVQFTVEVYEINEPEPYSESFDYLAVYLDDVWYSDHGGYTWHRVRDGRKAPFGFDSALEHKASALRRERRNQDELAKMESAIPDCPEGEHREFLRHQRECVVDS